MAATSTVLLIPLLPVLAQLCYYYPSGRRGICYWAMLLQCYSFAATMFTPVFCRENKSIAIMAGNNADVADASEAALQQQ